MPSGRRGQIPIMFFLALSLPLIPLFFLSPNNYIGNHTDAPTGSGLLWLYAPTGTPTAPRRTPTAHRPGAVSVGLVLFGQGSAGPQSNSSIDVDPLSAPGKAPWGHPVASRGK